MFTYLASDNCTVSIKISPHSHLFLHNWHDMWFLHFRQKCHLILSQQSRWKSGFVSCSGTFYTFYSTSIVLWHDSAAGCNTAVASDFIVAGLSSLFCQSSATVWEQCTAAGGGGGGGQRRVKIGSCTALASSCCLAPCEIWEGLVRGKCSTRGARCATCHNPR